jgi:type I restriction enzyme, S subunit
MTEKINNFPDIPLNWEWTKLGNVIEPSKEKIEPLNNYEIPYIGLEHIEKDTGKLLEHGNSNEVKSTKAKFSKGDLLYGKLRPYLNKVHVVNFDGICSTDILVFSKKPYISNQFLGLRFLCKDFVEYASQNVNGVQHPRVSFETLSEFPLSLPPLNEQKRIVAKIEALQERSQRVKTELDAIKPLLDQFRQSVLAAAFRGDLTADWRENNPDVEPADVLLEKIRVERRRRWEETELEKMKAQGKTPKDNKWKEKYKEPESIDNDNLPELPDGWSYSFIEILLSKKRIGLKTGPFGSLLKKHEYRTKGIPIVGIENIMTEGFIKNFKNYIDENKAKQLADYSVKVGDIIISRSGTVGEICVVPLEIGEAIISTNLIRVSLDDKVTFPNFFCFLFRGSTFILTQISNLCAGSTRDFLNQKILNSLIFPIPPLAEQQEIVRRIESLFKLADTIANQKSQIQNRLETLNQSILAKAFRGELVPQDPNDEPASVLLDRIQQEKAKLEKPKKQKSMPSGKTSANATEADNYTSKQLDLGL